MLQIKFTSVLKFIGFITSTVWRGIVLAVLWGWFMVPIGAPTVSIWEALGLSSIIGMTQTGTFLEVLHIQRTFDFLFGKAQPEEYAKHKKEREAVGWFAQFFYPSLYLLFGAVYHYLATGQVF